PGEVEPPVTGADRIDELPDGEDDPGEDYEGADHRHVQIGLPAGVGDVLEPPRRAHEAEGIFGEPGEIEADEPAPEDDLAEPLVERESERLGEPVGVAG